MNFESDMLESDKDKLEYFILRYFKRTLLDPVPSTVLMHMKHINHRFYDDLLRHYSDNIISKWIFIYRKKHGLDSHGRRERHLRDKTVLVDRGGWK